MKITHSAAPEMASPYRYLNGQFPPPIHLPIHSQTPPRLFTPKPIVADSVSGQEPEATLSLSDLHTAPIVISRATGSNKSSDCRLAVLESETFHDYVALAFNGNVAAKKYVRGFYNEQVGSDVQWVWQAAQQGHAAAQWFLGALQEAGLGVAQDEVAAEAWYQKAAEQDFGPAQLALGRVSFAGQDDEKSLYWFHLAAKKGNASAQCVLGGLYGVAFRAREDLAESFKWYRQAADQGNCKAQFGLARCYEFGWGVQKDGAEARSWCQKAAEQGELEAQFRLGQAYQDGDWGEKNGQQAAFWLLQSCLSSDGDTIDGDDLSLGKSVEFIPLLFREIKAFSQVKTLLLAENLITNAGARAIAQLIQENKTLEVLDLESNCFNNAGARAIAQALHANLVLKKLIVGEGEIAQPVRADIALSLKKNKNIAALKKAAQANPFRKSQELPLELIPAIVDLVIEIHQKSIGVQHTRKQTQRLLNEIRRSVYYGSSISPSE